MILRRYYIVIILFVGGITGSAILLAYALVHLNHLFTILCAVALLLALSLALIAYLNRTNRTLERFFLAVKNDDQGISYSTFGKNQVYGELTGLLDEVMRAMHRVRIEKEEQFQYLNQIMEHVDTGLIAYTSGGRIELINRSAMGLFGNLRPGSLQQLNRIRPEFKESLRELQPGQRRMLTLQVDHGLVQLALRKSCFKLEGREMEIVSFQDIQRELDQKELDSWKKLIQVLRHEIMNSVSTISSLATTLSRILGNPGSNIGPEDLTEQDLQDAVEGLEIIGTRSKGLLGFVEHYRSLTRLPEPSFQTLNVSELFQDISVLLHSQYENLKLRLDCSDDLLLVADKKMMEQVLLNLVKNAAEACENVNMAEVVISAGKEREDIIAIHVSDNGPGISEEVLPDIFVPFFSTKESGNGIGLSLSRQIMDLHKGKITVQSSPGKSTRFSLIFAQETNKDAD